MKNEKMCNIVKDMLPLYIDDLCSDESKKMVEDHIKECEECRHVLESMKEGEEAIASYDVNNFDSDEQLIKRVSKDINRKTGKSRKIAAACIGVVVVLLFGLYAPIKSISSEDLNVGVEVLDKQDCAIGSDGMKMEEFKGEMVLINDGDSENKSEKYVPVIIPGFSKVDGYDGLISESELSRIGSDQRYEGNGRMVYAGGYQGTGTAIQEGTEFEKVSVIRFYSDKIIKGYSISVKGDTLYIKNPRTTLFNNTSKTQGYFCDVELQEITKVVVVSGNDEEVIYGE
ncbi:zf-HC2 domain-containing protein [uncultured Eubacterium sp.]|uniref:zf-HC2 domain-containing protein n=1 Tax=uncultured Eubacterium sp. TaxID=165185 RepID=UPI0025957922|nr:zf-HC2 domain-containing protein [uncultured Eubacterium sp.]